MGSADGWLGVSLQYHNVYGARMPRDTPYAGVASPFRSALDQGEPPRVLEGAHRRDFVHVSDVAAANALAASAAGPGSGRLEAVNVCSGEPHTVGELAGALAAAVDGPEPVVVGGARPADVRHVVGDPSKGPARARVQRRGELRRRGAALRRGAVRASVTG